MLDRLLDLPDNELWDLIAGRAEPADAVAPLVAVLVATEAATDPTRPTKERR
jgi:succinate dehydrogenase flavin-adding protein (antitoxin of CptAB toxin-antitoxin module)